MRQLAIVAALLSSGQLVLGSQLRREPLIVSAPFAPLNLPDSPVELAPGTLNLGGRGVETLTIHLRTRRVSRPLADIVVRLAAGMFEGGMTTYRMRMATSVALPPAFTPSDDPSTWTVAIFERMHEDPPPDFRHVGRDTKFLLVVEQARDPSGALVDDNPDSREQLWKALGGGRP
jgi:hypothetical protein